MSLPDDIEIIGEWIHRLWTEKFCPIIVSGGIGGTHDDRTRDGIAKGLKVPLKKHEECHQILLIKYGPKFSEQRQRMTQLPEGSSLIANPIGAPGFYLKGVYAFPGFPSMLKPMLSEILPTLLAGSNGDTVVLKEEVLPTTEGRIAMDIEKFAQDHPDVHIGIYASDANFGKELTVRLRSTTPNPKTLQDFDQLIANLRQSL